MHPLLMMSPYESDCGNAIGRDPRTLTVEDFAAHLPDVQVGLRAVRAKCIDCCGGSAAEVRKCTAVLCPLWPLRMGRMPKALRVLRRAEEQTSDEGGAP
jgi:hypothetical protein